MTLDQLRYFSAAAKYEHLHRAAQSIPISVSVISQTVKALEEELACKLFVRDKKKIKLTQDGIRLLELAGDLLGRAEGIKKELGKASLDLSGHYRVGASHFLAAKLLTPAWSALQGKHPKLTVDVYSEATWVLVESILSGQLDYGVGFSPVLHPQLDLEEIHRGHSVVVARKNHPIFERDKKSPYKHLGDYPATMHMATDKIFSIRRYPAFKSLNLEKNIVFGFDSDFAAIESLKNSDNWTFMIDVVAAEFSQYLKVIPIPSKSDTEYTIQIIKHKSKKVDAALSESISLLKEKVKKMKGSV